MDSLTIMVSGEQATTALTTHGSLAVVGITQDFELAELLPLASVPVVMAMAAREAVWRLVGRMNEAVGRTEHELLVAHWVSAWAMTQSRARDL